MLAHPDTGVFLHSAVKQVKNKNNKEASMYRLLSLILLMAGLSSQLAAAGHCNFPGQDIKPGIVKIVGDNAVGSGVVISTNRVLTAAHVIEGMKKIDVVINGQAAPAGVVSRNLQTDLALLEVATRDIKPIKLRSGQLAGNAPVWTMGYPFGKRLKTGTGHYRKVFNGAIYTSAPVNFGQSGGGLVSCENGEHVLSGIIRAFGAEYRNGKLVRRDDISVASRTQDIRLFVNASGQLASLTK